MFYMDFDSLVYSCELFNYSIWSIYVEYVDEDV